MTKAINRIPHIYLTRTINNGYSNTKTRGLMLRISADSDCGVLALFDVAYHSAGSRTQTKEIAARQGLSKGHIEQAFQRLQARASGKKHERPHRRVPPCKGCRRDNDRGCHQSNEGRNPELDKEMIRDLGALRCTGLTRSLVLCASKGREIDRASGARSASGLKQKTRIT